MTGGGGDRPAAIRAEAVPGSSLTWRVDFGERRRAAADALVRADEQVIDALERLTIAYRTGNQRVGAAAADQLDRARRKRVEALRAYRTARNGPEVPQAPRTAPARHSEPSDAGGAA